MHIHSPHLVFSTIALLLLSACHGVVDLDMEIDVKSNEGIEDFELFLSIPYAQVLPLNETLSPHPQGGDCWGDYFFQFTTDNAKVRIYDLSAKRLIQTLSIPSSDRGFVSNCHCNTVCFGSKYYDENDDFPLIYVSTGYSSEGYSGALVYRITKNQERFSLSLVQTIRFPKDLTSWTEFVIAGEYAFLCYTSNRIIYKVHLPSITDGDVIIDKGLAIATYKFSPQASWMASSRNQDRLYYNEKIFVISGVPQAGEASVLMVLNLEKRLRETIVDFQKIGLYSEPESIFIWRGKLCIAFLDQIVNIEL